MPRTDALEYRVVCRNSIDRCCSAVRPWMIAQANSTGNEAVAVAVAYSLDVASVDPENQGNFRCPYGPHRVQVRVVGPWNDLAPADPEEAPANDDGLDEPPWPWQWANTNHKEKS